MGMHFVNGAFVDGEIEISEPEILLYEPLPTGKLQLTGVDYLVTKEAWEANPEHTGPPELMDSSFTCSTAPIASASRRSTRCTSGRGRTIPTARSRTGTRTCRVTRSPGRRTKHERFPHRGLTPSKVSDPLQLSYNSPTSGSDSLCARGRLYCPA